MIPESFIERLKQTIDIESVITPYTVLKRAGRGQVCLCPFHSEKTPSCHVYADSQSFYCFGCGAGGDAITFIRLIENLDYPEAVRFLAERAGLTVPEDEKGNETANKKALILEMNREAARFYRDMLYLPQGASGLDYLISRELSPNTLRKYGLGFAPPGWDLLKNHLRSLGKGYNEDDLVEASLLSRGRNNNTYDKFRNRVIFPIIDRRGNVIGFGGRAINPDDEPKYLNSSETPVFQKRYNLFSIGFAKNSSEKYMFLCEGYMDVIALNQAGFHNAVATLGTAITAEQVRLMRQYCEQVIIAYDADKAGQKAAEKAMNLLGEAGISAKVLDFSGSDVKDPDDYIKRYGKEAFAALAEKSRSVISFELKKASDGLNLEQPDNPEARAEYLKRAVVILAGINNKIEREVYISETARVCGVQEDALRANVNERIKYDLRREEKSEKSKIIKGNSRYGKSRGEISPEEGIIAYIFHSPDKLPIILSRLSPVDFPNDFLRKVFEILVLRLKKGLSTDIAALGSEFSTGEVGRIESIKLRYSDVPYTNDRLLDYIKKIEELKALKDKKIGADMTDQEALDYSKKLKYW
ncbi:MAG: DNA primase [Oscillospiraceae bacterium]|nr:DNA primase [Oscillospiraceae bacterium]